MANTVKPTKASTRVGKQFPNNPYDVRLSTTQVSRPMHRPELASENTETYGVGHGFVDGVALPRINFKVGLPPTRLKERRAQRTQVQKNPVFAPVPSTSKEHDVKGKQKEVENLFHLDAVKDEEAAACEATRSFIKRLEGQALTKAGIKRSKEEIAQITFEATEGSKFYDRQRDLDKDLAADITAVLLDLEAKLSRLKGDLRQEELEVEQMAKLLERERDLTRIVVCCDADAFYASVEELFEPSLIGKAFVVGHGIVLTASYEARKFGCRSAMGGHVAKKLCPQVIFVEPNFERYVEKSRQIMGVLQRYGQMAQCSLDEAYMDLTGHIRDSGLSTEEAVTRMRAAVYEETGLTVSCGIAPNKLIAKIAADKNKPNGQCHVKPDREAIMIFMYDLPVRKLPGIGRTAEAWLDALSIHTCADIWLNRGRLNLLRADIRDLIRAYLGIGSAAVVSGQKEDRVSTGRGWTFLPTSDYAQWLVELQAMAEEVAQDLAVAEIAGRSISLEIKYDTFEVETRTYSGTSTTYYSTSDDLFTIGKKLLDKEMEKRRLDLKQGLKVKGSYGVEQPTLRRLSLRVTHLRDDSRLGRASRGENNADLMTSWATGVIDLTNDDTTKHAMLSNAVCPLCEKEWEITSRRAFQIHVDRCLDADLPLTKKRRRSKPDDAFTRLMSRSHRL